MRTQERRERGAVLPDVAGKSRARRVWRLWWRFVVFLMGGLTVVFIPAPAAVAAAPPSRIVSLAPNLTEILYDLGVGQRIVAVTDHCDHPPSAGSKPRIGGFANPSLEAIVSLHPDWVVMTQDGNPPFLERRLRQLGIATYLFRATRIGELPGEIRAMGRLLSVGAIADRRAATIEARLHRIAGAPKPPARGKVRKALFIIQPEPLIAAGRGTTIDDAFAILGIENIATAGKARYPKLSMEEIIRLEPDALFFGKGHGSEAQAGHLIRRLATLNAVRAGRVYFIDEAIYRLGPRIAAGIEEMTACLTAAR